VFLFGAVGLGVLFTVAFLRMPAFGGAEHSYRDASVAAALRQMTPNAVSSVNFDQRALDTIGEELILLSAALGAVVLLRVTRQEEEEGGGRYRHGPAEVPDALRLIGYLLLPVTLVAGVYVVAHGALSPGGGFQGGVVLGTAVHLVYLAGDYPALQRLRPVRAFEAGEALAAGTFVTLGLVAAGQVPALNAVVGAEVGCAVVLLLAKFFEQALLIRETGTGNGPGSGVSRG
jgi:multicomponent Na+:H+ antiporter subunit B